MMLTKGLHRALRPHVVVKANMTIVQHPLVVMPLVNSTYNDLINSMYVTKIAKLARAKRDRDWWAYVWLHERMFRAEVLLANRDKIPPDRFWSLVAQVWIDAEIIHPDLATWIEIWKSKHPYRDRVMSGKEHAAQRALGTQATIFRGFAIEPEKCDVAARGMSWTLNREYAEHLAIFRASADRPSWLATATISVSKIQALFYRRGEDEVVVIPRHLRNLSVIRYDAHTA